MGEKDIAERTLLEKAEVFADVHNMIYFHGIQVIRPEDLESLPGFSAYTGTGKLRKQERDVVKLWKPRGICLTLFGIENQTRPDADIALRVMGYDGAAYRSQIQKGSDEPRYPVITTVLYFGDTHWRVARSLKERLTIMPELMPFVSDYKVNVIEVAFLPQEQVNLFKSDFRQVADYFVNSRLDKDYKGSREQITHVVEFFQLMKVLTGDKRFDDMDYDTLPEGGSSMFSIIDRAETRGRAEGRAEGIATGREAERVAMRDNIQMLLKSGQITEDIAALLFSNLKVAPKN